MDGQVVLVELRNSREVRASAESLSELTTR